MHGRFYPEGTDPPRFIHPTLPPFETETREMCSRQSNNDRAFNTLCLIVGICASVLCVAAATVAVSALIYLVNSI